VAYLRKHGGQLAIVHGERNKSSGNVEQRTLFVFYSKREARAAIGHAATKERARFRTLMESTYPAVKFNWTKLISEIEKRLDSLPAEYDKTNDKATSDFEDALARFTKELVLADPYEVPGASKLLRAHRQKLLVLKDLIDQQLSVFRRESKGKLRVVDNDDELPTRHADEFHWRHQLKGTDMPMSVEEWASDLYDRCEYDKARPIFELLVSSFDNYAEGHNYLGLIALKQNRLEDAIGEFEKTIKIGRTLFPRTMAKNDYWSDLSTRPYVRGLTNLAISLQMAGRFEDALRVSDQLAKECGDDHSADVYRASIYLNLGDWHKAETLAIKHIGWSTEEGFIAGFALYESGDREKAVEMFLHAALNNPQTAKLLLDLPKNEPTNSIAVDNHNAGIYTRQLLDAYLKKHKRSGYAFFQELCKKQAFIDLLNRVEKCAQNHTNRDSSSRENFDEWHRMRERSFAKLESKKLLKELRLQF
jgi:tetratricopeptide (TPR) repeat protein